MKGCDEELCPNWSGDGMVCPCALFGIECSCTEYVVPQADPACDRQIDPKCPIHGGVL